MHRRIWIILGTGAVLLVVAALLYTARGLGGGLPTFLVIGGGAAWTLAVVLSWRDLTRQLARRSARYGLNALVLSFIVAVILFLVGFIADRHAWRGDFTSAHEYSLSDKTLKVLQSLNKRVDIHIYYDRATRDTARDLVQEYVRRNGFLRMHLQDLNKDPELAERLGVRSLGTLVFDAGDKTERISTMGEEEVTNALIKVSRPGKKKVYFLTDHGEKDITGKGIAGYSTVAEVLRRENYDPEVLALAGATQVPRDCDVLVLAGPKSRLLEHEMLAVQRYLENGGRFLGMFDPRFYCGLEDYLLSWGVLVGGDRVIDPSPTGQLLGRGASTPLVNRYGMHPITRQFRLPTYFEMTRSVQPWKYYTGLAERQSLAFSGEQSWADGDMFGSSVSYGDSNDVAGPVSLGMAVRLDLTRGRPEDEPARLTPKPGDAAVQKEALDAAGAVAAREARLVVFGDSDFANNRNFPDMGNGNLFLNSIAWLAQDEDLIAVRPKNPDDRHVSLTKAQLGFLNLAALGVVPALVAALGAFVTLRRRARG